MRKYAKKRRRAPFNHTHTLMSSIRGLSSSARAVARAVTHAPQTPIDSTSRLPATIRRADIANPRTPSTSRSHSTRPTILPPLRRTPRHRNKSTLTTIKASPSASREAPTPIVFIHARHFNPAETCHSIYSDYITAFSSQGYECIVIDVEPDSLPSTSSQSLMSALEDDLSSTLRTASPFPPIMLASGLTSLLGEQYASSHPLSALVLRDPPLSTRKAHEENGELLPTPWEEYDFEPFFPVTVVWSKNGLPDGEELHRIEEFEERDERWVLDRGAESDVNELVSWLEDDCGVFKEEGQDENEDVDEDPSHLSSLPPSSSTSPPEWYDPTHYPTQRNNKKHPILIPTHHLRETFSRGGGKGGQAINKNMSRCDLTHIPTGLLVRVQQTRSLDQNREIARRRLSRMVEYYLKGEESMIGRERVRERIKKERKVKKQKTRAKVREGEEENRLSGKQKRALRLLAKEEKAASKGKQRP